MALVDPWNDSVPDGGDDPREGDDRIRELKRAAEERMRRGQHYWPSGGTIDQDSGKHELGADPDGNTGEFWFVESQGHAGNRSTPAVRFYDGAATTPDQVVFGEGRAGAAGRRYKLDTYSIDTQNIDVNGTADVFGLLTLGNQIARPAAQTSGTSPVSLSANTQILILTADISYVVNLPTVATAANRIYWVHFAAGALASRAVGLYPNGAETFFGGVTSKTMVIDGVIQFFGTMVAYCDGAVWHLLIENPYT